jgi:hypothetical protein
LFFAHANNSPEVDLRYAHSSQLTERFFSKWMKGYPEPYRQCDRKSAPF